MIESKSFECRHCGSRTYEQIGGAALYACGECSAVFKDPEKFSAYSLLASKLEQARKLFGPLVDAVEEEKQKRTSMTVEAIRDVVKLLEDTEVELPDDAQLVFYPDDKGNMKLIGYFYREDYGVD